MDETKTLGTIELVNRTSDACLVTHSGRFKMENESVMSSEPKKGEAPQKESVPSLLDIVVERPPGILTKKKGKSRTNKKKSKVIERPPVNLSKKKGKSRTKKKKSKVKLQKLTDADKANKYKIFVKKLKKDVTSQNLKEYFGRYGTIADVTIINQKTISAFVKFSKVDSLIELFKNTHVINDSTVEIHPNIHLKNEYRQSTKEKI